MHGNYRGGGGSTMAWGSAVDRGEGGGSSKSMMETYFYEIREISGGDHDL